MAKITVAGGPSDALNTPELETAEEAGTPEGLADSAPKHVDVRVAPTSKRARRRE